MDVLSNSGIAPRVAIHVPSDEVAIKNAAPAIKTIEFPFKIAAGEYHEFCALFELDAARSFRANIARLVAPRAHSVNATFMH